MSAPDRDRSQPPVEDVRGGHKETQTRFTAEPANDARIEQLASLELSNPFATAAYFRSRSSDGWRGWIIGMKGADGHLVLGCSAFVKTRGWNRKLEIPSLPCIDASSAFWPGLIAFCRRHYITKLELDTFGTPTGIRIPYIGDCVHHTRCEYILDLTGDIDARIDRRHRSHIKKAARSGIEVIRTRAPEAVAAHRKMIGLSMSRRRDRGEDVPFVGKAEGFTMLLDSGAGELFQAVLGDEVLASGLVLMAPGGAYFHSRGASPHGMRIGASHYLLRHIMEVLKDEGLTTFNIGGAEEGSGLARFKKRFGAQRMELTSATCYVGPGWVREFNRIAQRLRTDNHAITSGLARRLTTLVVYATDLTTAPHPSTSSCGRVAELNADTLRSMDYPDDDFRERQIQRLERFGTSYAYGVFEEGQLAHVAWLLPATAIAKDVPHVLTPHPGDAEITGAETLPAFRGRGIYPEVISCLLEQARKSGMRRVLMKAAHHNTASRSGIQKAGLQKIGSAYLLSIPIINRYIVWRTFK